MALITVSPVYRLLAVVLICSATGISASGVQRVKLFKLFSTNYLFTNYLNNFIIFYCHFVVIQKRIKNSLPCSIFKFHVTKYIQNLIHYFVILCYLFANIVFLL